MNKLALILLLSFCAYAAKEDSTANFVAYLAKLKESRVIGDEELLKIIEDADRGEIVSPIQHTKSVAHHIAHKNLNQIKKGVDAKALGEWCIRNLKDQERVRERREKTAEETKLIWNPQKPIKLSAGFLHTCAVDSSGKAVCWGNNNSGQSNVPSDLGVVQSISAGSYHTCAVKADGYVRCWGSEKIVPLDLGPVQSISAGAFKTCAINANGIVRCWDAYKDTIFSNLGPVRSISHGGGHACAIKADGYAACWGKNEIGQCSVPLDLGLVHSICTGSNHSCVIKDDGSVHCWGNNISGQSAVPSDLGPIQSISCGEFNSCSVTQNGTAHCWGNPSAVTRLTDLVQSISSGWEHACIAKAEGAVFCWGDNGQGQTDVPAGLKVSQ